MEKDIRDEFLVLRIAVMQDLLDMISNLKHLIETSEDLQTKLKLVSELSSLYSNINKTADGIERLIPDELDDTLFLDYERRKGRSQTWKDYVKYCDENNRNSLKKGEFFKKLKDMGFREGKSMGDNVLIPPGVR